MVTFIKAITQSFTKIYLKLHTLPTILIIAKFFFLKFWLLFLDNILDFNFFMSIFFLLILTSITFKSKYNNIINMFANYFSSHSKSGRWENVFYHSCHSVNDKKVMQHEGS